MNEQSNPTQQAAAKPGELTRQKILQHAAELASVEGLEGLTIGRMAKALQMSKSGLFAHFGSKESLQLATIEAAKERFEEWVFEPAQPMPQGLERFRAILENWLGYIEKSVFPGGCFFLAASIEFDSRPGVVGNRLAEIMREWHDQLLENAAIAIDHHELDPSADAQQLTFECIAAVQQANAWYQLFQNEESFERAHKAIRFRLDYNSRNSAGRKRVEPGQDYLF